MVEHNRERGKFFSYKGFLNNSDLDMGKLTDLDEHRPHRLAEVICVKCLHRYWCVWPEGTPLKDLECATCGAGFIVLTGQPTDEVATKRS